MRPRAVERDWRQAMPRAEPALSLARLPLLAVVRGQSVLLAEQLVVSPDGEHRSTIYDLVSQRP